MRSTYIRKYIHTYSQPDIHADVKTKLLRIDLEMLKMDIFIEIWSSNFFAITILSLRYLYGYKEVKMNKGHKPLLESIPLILSDTETTKIDVETN